MARSSGGRSRRESGNVLFLILIAAALFATLSYAVTQSTRSGSEDVGRETNQINNSTLIQYTAGIRAAALRMIFSKQPFDKIEFNAPGTFANCTPGFARCIFHPQGGAVSYILPSGEIMADKIAHPWVFNGANQINGLGISSSVDTPTPATADLIAFLPGISPRFCQSVNDINDIAGIPEETGIVFTSASNMENPDGSTDTSLTADGATIGAPNGTNTDNLNGKIFGCFLQNGSYVYYHALIEQ